MGYSIFTSHSFLYVLVGSLSLGLFSIAPNVAQASDFTALNDAADDFDDYDEETFDPFDISIIPSFAYEQEKATIAREVPCIPENSSLSPAQKTAKSLGYLIESNEKCSKGARLVDLNQLDYLAKKVTLGMEVRVGLYKDFEFRLSVPYVPYASTAVQRGGDSSLNLFDPSNETISKAAEAAFNPRKTARTSPEIFKQVEQFSNFLGNRFFEVPTMYDSKNTYTRSGFADPTFGLHYGIFNDQRDDTKATLNVGFDYTAPLAPIKKWDNTAVGEGLHKFEFSLQTSKRFAWIEPYFGFSIIGAMASGASPLYPLDDSSGEEWAYQIPPQTAVVTLGTEFIPYENVAKDQRYSVDVRFIIKYQSVGRAYSPLFDQFAHSSCRTKKIDELLPKFNPFGKLENPDDVACAWLLATPRFYHTSYDLDVKQVVPLIERKEDVTLAYNGVALMEGFATFTSRISLNAQPFSFLSVNVFGDVSLQTNHFISSDIYDIKKRREDNYFLDEHGRRMRMLDYLAFSMGASASLNF